MTRKNGTVAVAILIVLALGGNSYLSISDHNSLFGYVRAESLQRVHTIGERCESTEHQAKVLHHNLPPNHQGEADWFDQSYARCLVSLAKVERRAGVKYQP